MEPRPVAWFEVMAGFCSLRPIDWQYWSARCSAWFLISTQVSNCVPEL
ncbi:hypothetical protein WJ978_15940 [Achromobacter xylosoxidans]